MEVAQTAEVTTPAPGSGLAPMPPPLPRVSSLGYQVNHAARLLARALREEIEPLGVVPGQFVQLLALYEQDGLTQAELCQRVQIEQPTMAVTLSRMERDGLVLRVPDSTDRRRVRIRLTEHARELQPALVSALQRVNTVAAQGLSERELGAFMRTITRIIDNLHAGEGSVEGTG